VKIENIPIEHTIALTKENPKEDLNTEKLISNCKYCGENVEENTTYCPFCGSNLSV